MNYKRLLESSMPVVMDSVGIEEGQEVERMWLADMVDGKWVEDYVMVKRTAYDTVTDDKGAVFAHIENGLMLVKAPNVRHYRIPEAVYRLADNAFNGCTELRALDVPYTINDYEAEKAMKNCCRQVEIRVWNWPYEYARSKELEKEIAEGWTDEHGFVYSQDRKRLLKAAADVGVYRIPEGVEQIDRLAFVNCTFEELHIPYTCRLENLSEDELPVFGSERVQGCVLTWDRPYAQEDRIANPAYISADAETINKDGVVYSSSGKRLLCAHFTFDEVAYYVPDGVETICDYAFSFCKRFLTLSVPPSVRLIGDNLFGEGGGEIIIRKN